MPCARCKSMKKECGKDCEFAPHFPAEEPQKFDNIHRVYGADNFMNMLKGLSEERGEFVESMAYEAEVRVDNPVHGCLGKIKALEQEVERLKREKAQLSDKVKALEAVQSNHNPSPSPASPSRKPIALQVAHGLPKQMPLFEKCWLST